MDNLTHSLIGAALGQMGLKRKTALAMPTLIIAANIPDIDAGCTIYGIESLAMRRGLTHGPIAMLILPVLLTAAMLWWDQYKRKSDPGRAAVRPGWLLALAYIGTLSHPAFDWLNTYGVRVLEPFSSQWFYGDTLFIIDVWLWIMLGLGVWMSLRRERNGRADWRRPAIAAVLGASLYILGNGVITGRAEALAATRLAALQGPKPDLVVASPIPIQFWKREMLWRGEGRYGFGDFDLFSGLSLTGKSRADGMDNPSISKVAQSDAAARAFLFWSRAPILLDGNLRDQRYLHPLALNQFSVPIDQ